MFIPFLFVYEYFDKSQCLNLKVLGVHRLAPSGDRRFLRWENFGGKGSFTRVISIHPHFKHAFYDYQKVCMGFV